MENIVLRQQKASWGNFPLCLNVGSKLLVQTFLSPTANPLRSFATYRITFRLVELLVRQAELQTQTKRGVSCLCPTYLPTTAKICCGFGDFSGRVKGECFFWDSALNPKECGHISTICFRACSFRVCFCQRGGRVNQSVNLSFNNVNRRMLHNFKPFVFALVLISQSEHCIAVSPHQIQLTTLGPIIHDIQISATVNAQPLDRYEHLKTKPDIIHKLVSTTPQRFMHTTYDTPLWNIFLTDYPLADRRHEHNRQKLNQKERGVSIHQNHALRTDLFTIT